MEEELINKEIKHKEKARRSFAKAVSWRILGTITVIVVTYLFTYDVQLALNIGVIDVLANIVLYFIHERIWNLIDWGQESIDHSFKDNSIRSFLKTFTWRIIASGYLFALLYYLDETLGKSFIIASTDAIVNIIEYYFHERIWNKIKWAK